MILNLSFSKFLILFFVFFVCSFGGITETTTTTSPGKPITPPLTTTTTTTTLTNTNTDNKTEKFRSRDHIEKLLRLNLPPESYSSWFGGGQKEDVHKKLVEIYKNQIQPLENIYNFPDLGLTSISENEINAKPMILFIGPWSVGKTSMINYLLNIENTSYHLHTGAEPTTTEFTVLSYSDQYKLFDGKVVTAEQQFSDLEKFGNQFIERLKGVGLKNKLLERVTIVDTPGSIENRLQQERGYAYEDAMRWFVERADLIFLLFDPFRLDIGKELEGIFSSLKGKESKLRIVMNKADLVSGQELMRVYGTLLWNIAPLIKVVEPPRIYIGSFWGKEINKKSDKDLLLAEEKSLVSDLHQVVLTSTESKISLTRKHAKSVYLHAALIDRFLDVYNQERSFFGDNELKWQDILECPEKYEVFDKFLRKPWSLARSDLPKINYYKSFFKLNKLRKFSPLSYHCRIFWGCTEDKIKQAIQSSLPKLLLDHKKQSISTSMGDEDSCYDDACG